MPDLTAIGGMVSSIKAATEIVKALIGIRDAAMIQEKVIELNTVILSAQASAFTANAAQAELVDEIRTLKAEIADLKARETERSRYRLAEPSRGVFVYSLKPDMANGDPIHMLCANCFDRGRKTILQFWSESGDQTGWVCPECKRNIWMDARA